MAGEDILSALVRVEDGRRPALVSPDGATLSYEQLADSAEALSGKLRAAGVDGGDRVAFVLPNGLQVIEVLLAVTALGAVAAPLNPAYTGDEYAFYLGDLDPSVVLLPEGMFEAARRATPRTTPIADLGARSGGVLELTIEGRGLFAPRMRATASRDDIALLLHTSGTTSRPKQVPLRHRNLTAAARAIADFYRLTTEDVSYCCMPLFHVHGLVASALAALTVGGRVVVPQRFTGRGFWPQAREHGITWFSAGPTLHQMILDREDSDGAPPSLRFVRSCSSALSPALMGRAEERYGAPMLEAYGMTEASHQMTSNPLPPQPRAPGTVGIPAGAEARIVDAEHRDCAPGTPGEVVVRGPGVTSGYLNNPGANEEAFFDGWFRTGDLGVIEEGYLRLEGRLKEIIIRGDENISPSEVEDVLKEHPAVADAVCFGIADAKYGEVVGVAVELKGEADERELTEHCRERLAAFKVPAAVYLLDEIPRTPTGKVQRRRVGAELTGSRA